MIDKKDDDFLKHNIKGLMMSLVALWNDKMDAARAKTEFADVRPADIRVFAQLRGRSIKLSDIHREMGFSRQAAQQAIDRLAGHDMVEIAPDTGSKRDKIVTITARGQRWRTIAAQQIRAIEAECANAIGPAEAEALRQNLLVLLARATTAGD